MTLIHLKHAPMKKSMIVPEGASSDSDRGISNTSYTSSRRVPVAVLEVKTLLVMETLKW